MRYALLGFIAVACSQPPTHGTAQSPAPVPAGGGAVTLAASDVTIIWPLPADEAQRDSLIAATSVGKYGELVPASAYDVPVLDERDATATDGQHERARLRVVAARFEPCRGSFAAATDPSCVNQLRLVFQVLRPGGGSVGSSGAIGANDGAVLAFYKLTRPELLALARDLATLRDQHGGIAGNAPLGVHPLLAKDGVGGAYAKALQAKLLEHAGAERLTRITFFRRTRAREPLWEFGAFDVEGGKATRRPIATLAGDHQTLEGAGPRMVIDPQTSSPDNPDVLLTLFGAPRAPTEAERAAYGAVLRIENPAKHTPETMACAECHAAQRMRAAAERMFGLRANEPASDTLDLTVISATTRIDNENFHATSYLGTNLAVTTRTANDTTAVLAAMNNLLR
jgi:hypothetical protein